MKQKIANYYNRNFFENKEIRIPFVPSFVDQHSWYCYTIKVKKKYRNNLIKYLKKNNIETRLSFPPVHIQPYYKNRIKFKKNELKNSINAYNEFLDIPIWPSMNTNIQKKVIFTILNFFNKKK